MRFVQPAVLLLGTAMYVVLFSIGLSNLIAPTPPWVFVVFALWNLLVLAATVIAIIDAVRKVRVRNTGQLATDAFRVKVVSVPFFIFNNLTVVWLFFGGAVGLLLATPSVAAAFVISCVLTYPTLLTTSIYVWAAIMQLRRDRVIGSALTVLYALLSLVFVTDVLAAVLLFGHSRHRPRVALIALAIAGGLITIIVGVLGHLLLPSVLSGDSGFDGTYADPIVGAWIVVAVTGGLVVLATVLISVIARSSLRSEAQRARAAMGPVVQSDTPDVAPTG